MKLLRTLSTSRLLLLAALVCALGVGVTAVALAAGRGGGPVPQPKPLARALHDSIAAPAPSGITARIKFTNNLFPSGALGGPVGSALMSGASGRLWVTDDGRGRLELQADLGDVQVVWNKQQVTVFDASSNMVYRASLPQHSGSTGGQDSGAAPAVAEIARRT